MRRLNRYVEERAPWQLAKDEARPSELDTTLRSLAEGLRVVTVLLHPYMPETAASCWRRSAAEELALERRRLRRPARRRDGRRSCRRSSRSRSDRQPHAPRQHAGPDAEIVAAARAAGVTRILTIGIDAGLAPRRAGRRRGARRGLSAVGHHPNNATGYDDAHTAELRELARHPRCRAIGETGLDDYRDYAPRPDQERAFAAHIELARELGKPLVIHTRAAEDDTIATLARDAEGLEVILHCFSMPDRLEECLDHGWWISFAGNVTYPKAQRARVRRRARAARPHARRDRRALPDAAGGAQGAQPARLRRAHRALRRGARAGISYAELEAAVRPTRARLFGW